MLGDSLRRRHGAPEKAKREPRRERLRPRRGGWSGTSWPYWLLAAVVILFGSFGVGYLLSTQVLFPRPETAGTGVAVPSLYGETRAQAEALILEEGLVVGEVTELASLATAPDQVLAQRPLPGQQLRAGGAVSFAVSGGPPELRVPPLTGMSVGTARDLLERVGFEVEVRQLRGSTALEGTVAGTDPPAGTAGRLPAVVTVLVSAGPEPDTAAVDLPGDPMGDG